LAETSAYLPPVNFQSGGGGLVSTVTDYFRFAQCLANGGTLHGVRLLGRKTVELMTSNHIHPDLMPIAYNGVVETARHGVGFGLLGAVYLDMGLFGVMGNAGTFSWGGYADTYFWVDPTDAIVGIIMTQYLPSMTYLIRADYRTAVYQAMV
jgi:CubicO group peptidase (beta-lactamase class C family)